MEKSKPSFIKISDLNPESRGVNLVAKVVSVEEVQSKPRRSGETLKTVEVLIGDETACVNLHAVNEQIDLMQPGKFITIRNGKVNMIQNFMRLDVNKWGAIREGAEETFTGDVKESTNMSKTEYELVTPKKRGGGK
eukprot:CAMPEP_0115015820 /NCGR_PEP_ID=MMETSP0216-20121206/27022_1 /TAXON_ID=223996 /ORGANISM="Protocruzia adherens, Strain Boccale" /LENGTH=135 /DNA_ID=CAMNT_0002386065 /DNA_START=41 /DNA_END=448 /DNA_ORIENTATION=-